MAKHLDIPAVIKALERLPYVATEGTITDVSIGLTIAAAAGSLPKSTVSLTALEPMTKERAAKRSLSAFAGLGAQPLHSDGAHLAVPPDVLVLQSVGPSPTSTVVWPPAEKVAGQWARDLRRRVETLLPESVRYGLMTVWGDSGAFLVGPWEGRFRFDPGCMTPADRNGREAVQFFRESRADAYVHEWDSSDQLLFINNRFALHARNAVSEGEKRVLQRVGITWSDA